MLPVSSATRLACVLGHPVAHSLSPEIHNAAFAEAGVDAVYLAFDVDPERLGDVVAGLRAVGMLGANVTVPHKTAVLDHVDGRTEECTTVGAANTLFWDEDRLLADNTDAAGLEDVLRDELRIAPGTRALVFGAGGAARAAAVALARCGAAVAVRARRPEAAADVQRLAERSGAPPAGDAGNPDLVVNATPLGLRGEALPAYLMTLGPGQTALDLTYGPALTPFLQAAAASGARVLDGMPMLVAQAARAFARWTGREAPRAVMRAAAERAANPAY